MWAVIGYVIRGVFSSILGYSRVSKAISRVPQGRRRLPDGFPLVFRPFQPFSGSIRVDHRFSSRSLITRDPWGENASWGLKRDQIGREAVRSGPVPLRGIEKTQGEP